MRSPDQFNRGNLNERNIMKSTLSDTQITILKAATKRDDGNIEPLPNQVKGGARARVIQGLLSRELIIQRGHGDCESYYLTDAGYAAVGRKRPVSSAREEPTADNALSSRGDSKQALIIGMLKRPQGATLAQIVAATGWQSHTVRGAIAGSLKKKLGLTVESTKASGEDRVYRIAA
jgi:hypothetical protein